MYTYFIFYSLQREHWPIRYLLANGLGELAGPTDAHQCLVTLVYVWGEVALEQRLVDTTFDLAFDFVSFLNIW